MRLLTVLLLSVVSLVHATDLSNSYAEMLKQYTEESKNNKSPFSAEDIQIMEQAAKDLQATMPDPGLKAGDKAPLFTLGNAFGQKVSLQDKLAKGPVVMVFYRGAWCPFCNLHLRALQKAVPEMKKYKAELILVTPQKPDKSAEQINKDKYTFEVLSDLDSQVMKSYQLYFELPEKLNAVYMKHGLDVESFNGKGRAVLPVPGTYIIDQSGTIVLSQADVDYKKRSEPSDIIQKLKSISK